MYLDILKYHYRKVNFEKLNSILENVINNIYAHRFMSVE